MKKQTIKNGLQEILSREVVSNKKDREAFAKHLKSMEKSSKVKFILGGVHGFKVIKKKKK